jgi:FKBP-type peptidyl-prolyl cis-trans isomerase FklB
MKHGLKTILALGCAIAQLQFTSAAQPPPTNAVPPKPVPPKLSPAEMKQRMSTAIGMDIGKNLQRGGVDLDIDVMAAAMKDAMAGKPAQLTDQQVQEAIRMYRVESNAKREEQMRQTAGKNHTEGEAFLAENKKKPGVMTKEVALPSGKTAEFQYRVITNGTGPMPKTNDTVTVNYRGTLINGKEFDSSYKRGQPAKFGLNRVVRGWTEALSMMKTGSKWEVFLPPELAYGDQPQQAIEPGSTLIFEVELVGTETPAPPPPAANPQPLTSDIIKVPSAEELKKGAKIEVIKAEDLEKMTNNAAQKPK